MPTFPKLFHPMAHLHGLSHPMAHQSNVERRWHAPGCGVWACSIRLVQSRKRNDKLCCTPADLHRNKANVFCGCDHIPKETLVQPFFSCTECRLAIPENPISCLQPKLLCRPSVVHYQVCSHHRTIIKTLVLKGAVRDSKCSLSSPKMRLFLVYHRGQLEFCGGVSTPLSSPFLAD